jgi:DNA mismatch repair protein MutS
MPFHSILFESAGDRLETANREEPAFFADLNLDQLVQSLTAGRDEYELNPFFFTPLSSTRAVIYRHDIMRDLHTSGVLEAVKSFARSMHAVRANLSAGAKLRYSRQQQAWLVDSADAYRASIASFDAALHDVDLGSRGFRAFRDYLRSYVNSEPYKALVIDTETLKKQLEGVRYNLNIQANRVKVSRYTGEADYSADVLAAFERFKQGAVKDYRVHFSDWPDMNHVESAILDLVAKLHTEEFRALDDYCDRYRDYLDPTLVAFDREVQFYVAYCDFTAKLQSVGVPFCYPLVSSASKDVLCEDTFDIVLANKLVSEGSPLVRNSFHLTGAERIIVVSGPNQGGKTTFARTFGQLHYLASLGLQVPGSQAQLFLCDHIFAHFEREENLKDLVGKLQGELLRIHAILEQASPRSVIIMNEIFTSTTVQDAVALGSRILERVIALDALCVCVTFIDELAAISNTTVSMVSMVDPDNPALRTFRVERRPADGLAYAVAIAQKYELTYERLKARIAP